MKKWVADKRLEKMVAREDRMELRAKIAQVYGYKPEQMTDRLIEFLLEQAEKGIGPSRKDLAKAS